MRKESPFLRAQRYHEQSKQLRELAGTAERASDKALLELAESYDSIARGLLDRYGRLLHLHE